MYFIPLACSLSFIMTVFASDVQGDKNMCEFDVDKFKAEPLTTASFEDSFNWLKTKPEDATAVAILTKYTENYIIGFFPKGAQPEQVVDDFISVITKYNKAEKITKLVVESLNNISNVYPNAFKKECVKSLYDLLFESEEIIRPTVLLLLTLSYTSDKGTANILDQEENLKLIQQIFDFQSKKNDEEMTIYTLMLLLPLFESLGTIQIDIWNKIMLKLFKIINSWTSADSVTNSAFQLISDMTKNQNIVHIFTKATMEDIFEKMQKKGDKKNMVHANINANGFKVIERLVEKNDFNSFFNDEKLKKAVKIIEDFGSQSNSASLKVLENGLSFLKLINGDEKTQINSIFKTMYGIVKQDPKNLLVLHQKLEQLAIVYGYESPFKPLPVEETCPVEKIEFPEDDAEEENKDAKTVGKSFANIIRPNFFASYLVPLAFLILSNL